MPNDPAGYLSDSTYPDRFHRELAPSWLSYAAIQGGAPPRVLDGHFTYLDLGCGFAHSTIMNAGASPQAQFHACDFNATHIRGAESCAAQLGIENVHFHQAYFEELLDRELPQFDFIVAHGVCSWVSAEVYATILRIIRERLKPGGLAYLSYNCLPGWAAEAPLRRLILELAESVPGNSEERAGAALLAAQQLSNKKLKYFSENPTTLAAVEAFAQEPKNYLAHEFLNGSWVLHYSIDIADDMARAGANFVGSATLPDNHPILVVDKSAAEAVQRLPTRRQQQLAFDFAVNQRFRRDVFLKGPAPRPGPDEMLQNLDQTVLGCTTELEQIELQARIPRGKLTFQEPFIRDLRALLQQGSLSLGEIVKRLGGPGRNEVELRENLVYLLAAGTLTPFARASRSPAEGSLGSGAKRVVRNAFTRILHTGVAGMVPCEQLGSGVLVTPREAQEAIEWLGGGSAAAPPRLLRLALLGVAD